MDLLLVMTLSGSCFLSIYLLCTSLFKTLIAENVKYLMLKLSMLFLLVPPFVIKRLCFQVSRYLGQNALDSGIFISSSQKVKVLELTTNEVLYTSTRYKLFLIIGVIWIIFSLITFLQQTAKYIKKKRKFTRISEQITDPNILYLLQKEKSNLHIKRNIQLYFRNSTDSAFTIGIFKPAIYLPLNSDPDLIQIIIRHELIHIKNFDIFFKFLCILIRSIYWFNPLIYYLQKEIDTVSETCCDYYTVRSMDRNYRRLYAQLIIKNATVTKYDNQLILSALNNNAKKTKERVELIMKLEKKSILRSLLSLLLAVVAIISSSATAFAYEETHEIKGFEKEFTMGSNDYMIITSEEPVLKTFEYPIIFDKQFITQEGSILNLEGNMDERSFCFVHTYKPGTIQMHNELSSGGCTVSLYSGQKCIYCYASIRGDLISEHNYTKCPH